MKPLLEARAHGIITPLQRAVLDAVFESTLARNAFALAGGTALAEYYFGHRLSVDLDIFGLHPENVPILAAEVARILPATIPNVAVDMEIRGAVFRRLLVTQSNEPPLQVDLSALDPPLIADFCAVEHVNVLSIDDLAVGKLMAVCDRVEIRDAIDLWSLAQNGFELERVRQQMLLKDAGLAHHPLGLIEMLGHLERIVETVQWPRMFLDLAPSTLRTFVHALAETFTTAIALDATTISSKLRHREEPFGDHRSDE